MKSHAIHQPHSLARLHVGPTAVKQIKTAGDKILEIQKDGLEGLTLSVTPDESSSLS